MHIALALALVALLLLGCAPLSTVASSPDSIVTQHTSMAGIADDGPAASRLAASHCAATGRTATAISTTQGVAGSGTIIITWACR